MAGRVRAPRKYPDLLLSRRSPAVSTPAITWIRAVHLSCGESGPAPARMSVPRAGSQYPAPAIFTLRH